MVSKLISFYERSVNGLFRENENFSRGSSFYAHFLEIHCFRLRDFGKGDFFMLDFLACRSHRRGQSFELERDVYSGLGLY